MNHPQGVTLDLLTDLIARLDGMLCQVETTRLDFQESMQADAGKGIWTPESGSSRQVMPINPELQHALSKANPPHPKSMDQLMLELYGLHARLGTLLLELECHRGSIDSATCDAE